MDRPEFLKQLDELLELEPGTLQGGERLDELQEWNSLAIIGYMALASENFGVIVSPKQIAACVTIDDLVRLAQPA